MKLFLSAVFMFAALFSNAQTYPLTAQNNVIKLESLGWKVDGYHVKVTNLVNCSTTARIDYKNTSNVTTTKDTVLTGNQTAEIVLTNLYPTAISLMGHKVAGAACCPNASTACVTVGINFHVLAIKFKSINAERVDANTIKVTFESEEDLSLKYYSIKVSQDGKTFKEVYVIFPDGVQASKKYVSTIKVY